MYIWYDHTEEDGRVTVNVFIERENGYTSMSQETFEDKYGPLEDYLVD